IVVEHAVDAVADLEGELLVLEFFEPLVPADQVEAARAVGILALAGIEQILIEYDPQDDLAAGAAGQLGPSRLTAPRPGPLPDLIAMLQNTGHSTLQQKGPAPGRAETHLPMVS